MNYHDVHFEYISGQNDAIDLLSPQSKSKCYLEGWRDTKRKLAQGKLCKAYENPRDLPPQEEGEEF